MDLQKCLPWGVFLCEDWSMINEDLIRSRMKFWGYGSFEAPVWFVGMEEGLAGTKEPELEERFRATYGKPTVDIRQDMKNIPEHMKFFNGDRSPIQSTWKYPIALYLYLKDKDFSKLSGDDRKEAIRKYQVYDLCDMERKENTLFELMPLPSKNIDKSTWMYTGVEGFDEKKEYIKKYIVDRTQEFKKLIEQHKPSLVVFYSTTYLPYWVEVAGKELDMIIEFKEEKKSVKMYFAKNACTDFCVIPHGTSFGMSYDKLFKFLEKIRDQIQIFKNKV